MIPIYSLDLSAFNLVHGSDQSIQQGIGTPQYMYNYMYVFCIHLMENIPYNIQQQQDSEVANRNTVLHMKQYYTQ